MTPTLRNLMQSLTDMPPVIYLVLQPLNAAEVVCIIHRNTFIIRCIRSSTGSRSNATCCQSRSRVALQLALMRSSYWPSFTDLRRLQQPASQQSSTNCRTYYRTSGPDIDTDQYISCSDVNCPGDNQSVNPDLLSLLDTHGLQQFVTTATRRMPTGSSLLDVVLANHTTRRLQQVAVSTTHQVSGHDLVTWLFSVKSRPPRQVLTHRFCNIKKLDIQQFQEEVSQSCSRNQLLQLTSLQISLIKL